jgi:hypothetical protein
MKHASSIHARWFYGLLSLASLTSAGCLKELGLGGTTVDLGAAATSGGFSVGVGGSPGASGGVGGGPAFAVSTGVGVGGSPGSAVSTGAGVGGGTAVTTGVGGSPGTTASSGGVGGGAASGCQLTPEPVACNFSHLNADCAPYGAVCDFIFGQCSCCFVHGVLTCTTDADCEASFGASSFCSAGTCGCK